MARTPRRPTVPATVTVTIPGPWLLALSAAAVADSLSTVLGLTLVPTARETQTLGRELIAEFGPVLGMTLAAAITIAAFVLLAETTYAIVRRVPYVASQFAHACRHACYGAGTLGSLYFATTNTLLLL